MSHYKNKISTTQRIYNLGKNTILGKIIMYSLVVIHITLCRDVVINYHVIVT